MMPLRADSSDRLDSILIVNCRDNTAANLYSQGQFTGFTKGVYDELSQIREDRTGVSSYQSCWQVIYMVLWEILHDTQMANQCPSSPFCMSCSPSAFWCTAIFEVAASS